MTVAVGTPEPGSLLAQLEASQRTGSAGLSG